EVVDARADHLLERRVDHLDLLAMRSEDALAVDALLEQFGEGRIDLHGVEPIVREHAPADLGSDRPRAGADLEDARRGALAAQRPGQRAGEEPAAGEDGAGMMEVAAKLAEETAILRPDAHPCALAITSSRRGV